LPFANSIQTITNVNQEEFRFFEHLELFFFLVAAYLKVNHRDRAEIVGFQTSRNCIASFRGASAS